MADRVPPPSAEELEKMNPVSFFSLAVGYLPPSFRSRAIRLLAKELDFVPDPSPIEERNMMIRRYDIEFLAQDLGPTARANEIARDLRIATTTRKLINQRALAARLILDRNKGRALSARSIISIISGT